MFDQIKQFECYQKGDIDEAIIAATREYIPIYLIRQANGSPADFVSRQVKTDFDNMMKLFKSDEMIMKFDKPPQLNARQDLNDLSNICSTLASLIYMKARYTKIDMINAILYFNSDQGPGQLQFYNSQGGHHIYE